MTENEIWIKKQQELLIGNATKGIKPKRRYLHFDNRITKLSQEIQFKIFTPEEILKHSFYPFLQYKKTYRRRKRTENFSGYEQKERSISYASHLDTLIFSWYAHILSIHYEALLAKLKIDDSVIAYRPQRGSNIDHACVAFRNISDIGESNVICADISGFFDNLSHALLKRAWLNVLQSEGIVLEVLPEDHYQIFQTITKFSSVDVSEVYDALEIDRKSSQEKKLVRLCSAREFREKIADKGLVKSNKKKKGIPQGSSISAILANIYMIDFDCEIKRQTERWGGKYYRYSDDVIVIVPKEINRSEVMTFIEKQSKDMELDISTDKTELFDFRNERGLLISRNSKTGRKKSLNYLGISFDGKRILLKHASLAGYQKKVVSAVRSALSYSFKKAKPIPKRKIYERYTKFGRQNFQSYIQRVVITLKKYGFDSLPLKHQTTDYFVHRTMKRLREVVRIQLVKRQQRRVERQSKYKRL